MLSVAGGFVGITALTVLAAAPGAAATTCTGSATALNVSAGVLSTLKVDLGTQTVNYPDGGRNALLDLNIRNAGQHGFASGHAGLVTANILKAESDIQDKNLKSESDLTEVNVLGLIHVDVLKTSCTANANGVSGTGDIVGLRIGNTAVTIDNNTPISDLSGKVNQLLAQIAGPVVTVNFDEQIRNGSTLTVNGLDVKVDTNALDPLGLLHTLGLDKVTNKLNLATANIIVSQSVCAQGDVPGSGGGTGSGTPTTGPTTGNGGGTTSTPATTSAAAPTAATTTAPAVANASDNKNLPFTGVAGILPMLLGAVVLVAAGVGLFLFNRKRAARAGSDS